MASETESGKCIFTKNSTFNSYNDFENAVKNYEKINNVQLWKRDARKIQNMQSKAPNNKILCIV